MRRPEGRANRADARQHPAMEFRRQWFQHHRAAGGRGCRQRNGRHAGDQRRRRPLLPGRDDHGPARLQQRLPRIGPEESLGLEPSFCPVSSRYQHDGRTGWRDEGGVFCAPNSSTTKVFAPSAALAGLCVAPRADPTYGDRQGTLTAEKAWVRSYVDETYLWYNEVPEISPVSYPTPEDWFDVLKTPARTASGRAKDRFHFYYDTPTWEALQQGSDSGYGFELAALSTTPPRKYYIAYSEPNSPAGVANIARRTDPDRRRRGPGQWQRHQYVECRPFSRRRGRATYIQPAGPGRAIAPHRDADVGGRVHLSGANRFHPQHGEWQGRLHIVQRPQLSGGGRADRRHQAAQDCGHPGSGARPALQRRRPALHREPARLYDCRAGVQWQDFRKIYVQRQAQRRHQRPGQHLSVFRHQQRIRRHRHHR